MLKSKLIPKVIILTAALLVLGGCASTPTATTQTPAAGTELKIFQGVGQTPVFRVGPGMDEKGGQIYSISYTTASALFDKDGKVLSVNFDALEFLSPNDADHVGVPMFSGWPTQAGYLGTVSNTPETAAKEVSLWKTKRERGDADYGMNWSEQIGNYQKFFKGKTVAEIEQWVAKNTSDKNLRPLTVKMEDAKDKEKFAKLTDQEKAALADVTAGATISVNDGHGNFIGALKKAYENKVELTLPLK